VLMKVIYSSSVQGVHIKRQTMTVVPTRIR
jgi:hypothetical protein